MRVLVLTSLFPNRVMPLHGIFVQQRVSALAQRKDTSVRVVAPVPYCPEWAPIGYQSWSRVPRREIINDLDVTHPRYPMIPKVSMPLHGALMFAGIAAAVRKIHRTWPIDCIDAHYLYPDAMAAVRIGRMLGVPVCVSARGSDVSLFTQFGTIRPKLRWTLEKCDAAIAVSEALRQQMLALSPSTAVHVVPNGISAEKFALRPQSECRKRLNIATDRKMALCVAALVAVKNHTRLLTAFAQIARELSTADLYLVGDGILREQLQELAATLGLADRVKFIGKIPHDELKYWYNAADITCLASDREGWPNVLSESLACGIPAVVTDAGGCREVICTPALGMVTAQDADEFADALSAALVREWDRREIAEYAARRTWSVVAEEVESVLHTAIENHAMRNRVAVAAVAKT